MRKGILFLSIAVLLFVIYTPISMAWLLKEQNEKAKHRTELTQYGINLSGPEKKHIIHLNEFSDYIVDQDYENNLTAWLWHVGDTLFVDMQGHDAFPALRQMPTKNWQDSITKDVLYDRIRIAVDEGLTRKSHLNYAFSFGDWAQVAGNLLGEYVEGSRKQCDIPWKMETSGPDWTFHAAIPLHGNKKFGLDLGRKYYGRRDIFLMGTKTPDKFMAVSLVDD